MLLFRPWITHLTSNNLLSVFQLLVIALSNFILGSTLPYSIRGIDVGLANGEFCEGDLWSSASPTCSETCAPRFTTRAFVLH